MREVAGNDKVFERMIRGNDEITYHLMYTRREHGNARLLTDDRSCILALSREGRPAVVFLSEAPDAALEIKLARLLADHMTDMGELKVNAYAKYIDGVQKRVSAMTGIPCSPNRTLNAYACFQVNQTEKRGYMVRPECKFQGDMALLFCELQYDDGHVTVSEAEAEEFAKNMEASDSFFLWKDGAIVSMARVTQQSSQYAAIDMVVTERAKRGNGYAEMLVGGICEELLRNHVTPVLYADTACYSSNRLYQKIGFEKMGEITQFVFRA